MRHPTTRPTVRASGFTLLEVIVALLVLSVTVTFIYQVLQNSVRGQDMVREDLRRPKITNAILGQVFKDFRYLYWDGFTGNTGFIGESGTESGKDADHIDFVTARPSRMAQLEEESLTDPVASPVTEVGYALRANEDNSDYLELYRREDWFVDDNPVRGGKYTLVYDKITKFDLLYFPIPEENVDGKGEKDWDTRTRRKLPYAIVLELTFDEGGRDEASSRDREENEELISRIIVLKGAYNVAPKTAPGQENSTPTPGR